MDLKNKIINYENMEYCYCYQCGKIKEKSDLVLTENGLQCRKCGSIHLGEAGWVSCPYNKMTAVKCPIGGRGIITTDYGLECMDRCYFRV